MLPREGVGKEDSLEIKQRIQHLSLSETIADIFPNNGQNKYVHY